MSRSDLRFIGAWALVSAAAVAAAVTVASATFAVTLPAVILVILLEGLVLGVGQRSILERRRSAIAHGWLLATILGVVIGRLVEFAADTGSASAAIARLPVAVQDAYGPLFGLLVGAVMALPQARLIALRMRGAGWWIAACALAWAGAFPLLRLALGVPAAHSGASPLEAFVTLLGIFAGVGALVGAIEATVMARLLRLHDVAGERPPHRGSPSDYALVRSLELRVPAGAIARLVRDTTPHLRDAAIGDFPLAVDLVPPAGLETDFLLAIASCERGKVHLRFEGQLRVDDVDDDRSRVVIEGRYDGHGRDEIRVVLDRIVREIARESGHGPAR